MVEPTGLETLLFAFSKLLKFIASGTWTFLNTQFALTLIGTFSAAFAGAYGASAIIEGNKRRDDLLRELRITNAAIMVSFEICNSFLSMKKQWVRDLGANYHQLKSNFDDFRDKRRNGRIPKDQPFVFEADFITLNPMVMPSEILVKQVFEDITSPARAYTLTNTLIRTMDSLNQSILERNRLIREWKEKKQVSNNELAIFYFGLPDGSGHVDSSYPNSIQAICSLTDDCIFFSQLLCTDLVEHGDKIRKRLGKLGPRVNRPNFSNAVELGLMPSDDNYKDWTKMFVKHGDQEK